MVRREWVSAWPGEVRHGLDLREQLGGGAQQVGRGDGAEFLALE